MPTSTLPLKFWSRFKKDPFAVAALIVIGIYIGLAVGSGLGILFPHVNDVHYDQAYFPPSAAHWFGTDVFGRDVFSKGVYGARTAMFIGLVSTLIAIPIGTLLGALAGYFGGVLDELVVWAYSTVDSVPSILMIIALAYSLGPGLVNTYIAIGATSWVSLCRIVRGEFLKHKAREYVVAAGALGASHLRRIVIHILPNIAHLILIQFTLGFIYAIKSEVILSYLGLGVEAGQFSWGRMIDDSKQQLVQGQWWELTCATLFMFFIVLAFSLLNEGLTAAADARARP